MPRWVAVVAVLVAAYAAWRWVRYRPSGGEDAPPLTLGPEPEQVELDETIPVTVHRGERTFFILKTHSYDIVGKVLSATTYDYTWTNQFFDVDLGLAWGDQVDRLEREYSFHQDARWLFWQTDRQVSPTERSYVGTHVGNVHTIPAEGQDRIGRALRSASAGDLVHLQGFLVTIQDAGTNVLSRSSTSRADSGGGACEVMWVDRVQINDQLWQ